MDKEEAFRDFCREHGLSLDWMYVGEIEGLVSRVASTSPRADRLRPGGYENDPRFKTEEESRGGRQLVSSDSKQSQSAKQSKPHLRASTRGADSACPAPHQGAEYKCGSYPLIPSPIDQNPCAHWRSPMDMMRQG